MATIATQPSNVFQGQRVQFVATTTLTAPYTVTWQIDGVVGMPAVDPSDDLRATWEIPPDQAAGAYTVRVTIQKGGSPDDIETETVIITPRPLADGDNIAVSLSPRELPATGNASLWAAIRNSTDALSFQDYQEFIEPVMCGTYFAHAPGGWNPLLPGGRGKSLPFPDVEAYRLLKIATEVFMMVRCGVLIDFNNLGAPFEGLDLEEERRRLGREDLTIDDLKRLWENLIIPTDKGGPHGTLPYLAVIQHQLGGPVVDQDSFGLQCYGILQDKLSNPCFLELIWSYWEEEGMLVQTLNAISRRFQNRHSGGDVDRLAHLEITPLRPLNNLLWGYVQDEQHRLTVLRRAYEYDHHYGITLRGKAVPELRGADSRSQFLEAFHNLLYLATIFFKEDDDTTVVADGFPVLNALKDVHLLLTEGQHNQYGDLPWTARQEMLMQQWILARPEIREFLPSRAMVAYPEPWMGPADSMKRLAGWADVSVMHFHNLARFGERILLSIRWGNWNSIIDRDEAALWARSWRPEIQGYIHSYRATTGADLTSEPVDFTMPASLLARRRQAQLPGRQQVPIGPAPPRVGRPYGQLQRRSPAQIERRSGGER